MEIGLVNVHVSMIMPVVVAMSMSVIVVQDLHLNQVENEANDCSEEHDVGIDLNWRQNSPNSLVGQPNGDSDEEYN